MVRALIISLAVAACNGGPVTETTDTTQTTPDPQVTDTFPQTLITPVDVLWVVDSGWAEAQEALNNDLIDDAMHLYLLADPSWRVGVLDAGAEGPEFGVIRGVTETWPRTNPLSVLPDDARGSARYREAVYTAFETLGSEGANAEFLRSDAHLYIVYMGARQDSSDDVTLPIEYFESWLTDLPPSDSKRISILTDTGSAPYWEPQVFGGGNMFVAGSFRDAVLAMFLDSMGQRVTFTLTQPALEAPTVATVIYREQRTDYAIDLDYTYDPVTNSITFTSVVPPPDSTIEVTYIPASGVGTTPTASAQ